MDERTQNQQQAPPESQTATATAQADGTDGGEDLLDLLQRERAEFLNYKRRVERERAGDRDVMQASLLGQILPLLDDLERALTQVPADLQAHPWVQGAALSRNRLTHAMGQLGLERIGQEGDPFDPARHEALFFEGRPDASDRRVASVIRPGYQFGARLLRPAQVSVVGPAEESQSSSTEQTTEERPAVATHRSRKHNAGE